MKTIKLSELCDTHRLVTCKKCDRCGTIPKKGKLHFAHCVPKWIDRDMDYDYFLISLCDQCHKVLEKKQLDLALEFIGAEK